MRWKPCRMLAIIDVNAIRSKSGKTPRRRANGWHWAIPLGSDGVAATCGLHRPALGREVGRDLAKIFPRKLLSYGRHNRAVAITASVVVQLLDEIALLLTPNDRNGFRVGRDAILAVACSARLRFCLDVVVCI